MSEIVRIPFHGSEVLAVDIDEKPHAIFRPVVESMGLAYSSQLQRLKRQPWASVVVINTQMPGAAQTREVVAVPTRTLAMWLATIPVSRVNEQARPLLEAYQREVADAIDAYWAKGGAINPRASREQLQEIAATAEARSEVLDELEVAAQNVRLAQRNFNLVKEKRALTARAEDAECRLAVAKPKADAWDSLASAEGDYSVGDAAKILSRDPMITIGQNRLFELLGEWGWLFRQKSDNCWRAIQDHVDLGRLSERTSHRVSKRTGKKLTDTPPQVRVSVKGLKEIRQRMIQQPALFEIEAA